MITRNFHNEDHWNPLARAVDHVYLGGRKTPGLADIVGASSPRKWEERAGYALSGAVVVYTGLALAHFSIKLRLYTEQDWEDWHAFRPTVERLPRAYARSGALDIVHPITQHLGIRAIVVEEILQPEQTNDGEWTIELKVIEYRSPVVSVAKAEGAAATPQDPEDARLRDISGKLSNAGIGFIDNAALDALSALGQR
jgi:hypothetical protein